jgi:hypothetical protein
MAVYLGNQLLNAASHITSTHQMAVQLTRKLEGVGHKLSWTIIFCRINSFLTYTTGK